jgi:predicted DNA-binding protein (MmcQ/YjbR family)
MSKGSGAPNAKTRGFEEEVRKIALSYPQTREDRPWGHSAFKVKRKVFLFMGADALGLGLSVKLGPSHKDALGLPYTEPTHYGLGKHGWVSARFAPDEDIPLGMVKGWIAESFEGVAPKSLLKGAVGGGARLVRKPRSSARGRQGFK